MYEQYKLSDEDIKIGIQDFWTQLLIEARRYNIDLKRIEDLKSLKPKISYIVGQPGSGKTTLSKLKEEQYRENNECVVEIGSDKIATYHRYYNELLRLPPNACYILSRNFVKIAEPAISSVIMENGINTIREISMTKGEKDYEDILKYKKAGFQVEVNIVAVDKYESFLSCIERDIKLLELGFDPRPVSRNNHDRMYEGFMQEIIEIEKRELCDTFNVFIRGEAFNKLKLVYDSKNRQYASVNEAIIMERAKNRKQIMNNYNEYSNRLNESKNKLKKLISDEEILSNYLLELNKLEEEFIDELAISNKERE